MNSVYILKVALTEFANVLDVEQERKIGIENDSMVVGLSSWFCCHFLKQKRLRRAS